MVQTNCRGIYVSVCSKNWNSLIGMQKYSKVKKKTVTSMRYGPNARLYDKDNYVDINDFNLRLYW